MLKSAQISQLSVLLLYLRTQGTTLKSISFSIVNLRVQYLETKPATDYKYIINKRCHGEFLKHLVFVESWNGGDN